MDVAPLHVCVFVEREDDLARISKEPLRGTFCRKERIMHLFLREYAPPQAEMNVHLDQCGGTLVVEGEPPERCEVEIHHLSEIYARTPFKTEPMRVLRESAVLLLGVGSLGSSIALSVARAGVGELIVADPCRLEIHNVSRHEGGLLEVGRSKVDIVAERIASIDPKIAMERHGENIFSWDDENLQRLFRRLSLVVASTDKISAQLLANHWAVRVGIPAVFAGCYEEARGGEVFCFLPGSGGPCYACLRGGMPQPPRGAIDYSRVSSPNEYEGEPGLHAAVDQVANVASQVALSVLLSKEPDSKLGKLIDRQRSFLLVGTALSHGFYRFRRAFDIYFQPLSGPRKDCSECRTRSEGALSWDG